MSECPSGFLMEETGNKQVSYKCAKAERNERHDDLNQDGLGVFFRF